MSHPGRHPRAVLFLDDDDDLRAIVVVLLQSLGATCLSAASVGELRQAAGRPQDYGLAILDINLGAGMPSGLDAYQWLRGAGFDGDVVFLTGHARNHPLVEAAKLIGNATVLEKPITADQLQALLAESER
jgi:DNA-binding NtrC family response regulator